MEYLRKLQNRQGHFKAEGSVTIFLALTLVLILSFLFSMVELARVHGLKGTAERRLKLRSESLQGAYNQELWEHYGLLFLDMSYGSGEPGKRLMEEVIMEDENREGKEQHFYQMAVKDAEIEAFSLATDNKGAEFKRQACKVAKEKADKEKADNEEIEALKQLIADWKMLEQKDIDFEEKWKEALRAEEKAQSYVEDMELGQAEKEIKIGKSTGENLPQNPLHYVSQLKNTSLLALILKEPAKLSGKAIDTKMAVYNRELFCGNLEVQPESNVDKMWLVQYMNLCFSSKIMMRESKAALDYELEYCVAGKNTDVQNLEEVAKELFTLRERANFESLMQDVSKQSLAMEIAVEEVGFTRSESLIEAVKTGILLAWSYVESILDLRCLLEGGKVPFIKDNTQWRSNLSHIKEAVENMENAGSEGVSYETYLQVLLCLTDEEVLTDRVLDIIERNIRVFSGNEAMRMDAMVSAADVTVVYTANPLFLNVIPMVQKVDGNYQFVETKRITY